MRLREADEASRPNHERTKAARAKAAASLLEAVKKQKEPKKRQGPRPRNREKRTRVPRSPSIDDRLVGQALEFAFGWDENTLKVAKSVERLARLQLKKGFSGEWFWGIVVDVGDDDGECLYTVKYEDRGGGGETMAAADLAGGLIPETESGHWGTVENLNGVILEVVVSKTKASQRRTTTAKALLYNRWDEDLYEDGDEDAESWLEVISKIYGMDGKNG
mmetsp:Transcript_32600/g.73628  ORF Transcript_32600/g.73628 Transcript_32600/m.73628 type:complete len:219 (-) Transcript_32600:392-1048(-)